MEKFNYVVVGSGPSVYRFLLGMKDSKRQIARNNLNEFNDVN